MELDNRNTNIQNESDKNKKLYEDIRIQITLIKHERDRLENKVIHITSKFDESEKKVQELSMQAQELHEIKPKYIQIQEELTNTQLLYENTYQELQNIQKTSQNLESNLRTRIHTCEDEINMYKQEMCDKQVRVGELEILCANQRKSIDSTARLRQELKEADETNNRLLGM